MKSLDLLRKLKKKKRRRRSREQHLFNYSIKRAFSPPKEMKTR